MKLLSVFVCSTTLFCVSASTLLNNGRLPRAAGCHYQPKCDNSGEEKIPIPCEGFCKSYHFCQNGTYTFKTCTGSQNFNNIKRKCDSNFKDCDWWRDDETTTSANSPGPNVPTTTDATSNTDFPGTETTAEPTTEGPCRVYVQCDATGTELKPIPCAGYCNKYFLCQEGHFSVRNCPPFLRFHNVTRQCSYNFWNCDWYKSLSTGTTTTSAIDIVTTSTTITTTSKPTSTSIGTTLPWSTTTLPWSTTTTSHANSILKPAISLSLTFLGLVLSRHL